MPLERELKRAGCPPLESYEVLREIHESGDGQLPTVELQIRLSVPGHRLSRLIDRLAKDGYVGREKATSDAGTHVVITDLGRRASNNAASVDANQAFLEQWGVENGCTAPTRPRSPGTTSRSGAAWSRFSTSFKIRWKLA